MQYSTARPLTVSWPFHVTFPRWGLHSAGLQAFRHRRDQSLEANRLSFCDATPRPGLGEAQVGGSVAAFWRCSTGG